MFKNEYTLNRKLITEYVLNVLCKNIIIVGIVIMIFGLVLFLTNTISLMGLYGELFIAFCMLFGPIIICKHKNYKEETRKGVALEYSTRAIPA